MEFSDEQIQVLLEALRVLSAFSASETGSDSLFSATVSEDECSRTALMQYLFEEAYECDPLDVIDSLAGK